ncbi:MAG: ATP-binding cassette domain-containing protein [Bacilli bacterium]|nr:ATP-binding cassette domain-containing protein [Bacilli bacterium]
MITFLNVSKKYNDKIIFDNVNFSISGCGVYLVKGKSGVGKTTLLNMISGIDGYKGKIECNRKNISYVFQNTCLIEHLNVKEHLDLYGISYCVLKKYDLKDKLYSKTCELSTGEKARIGVILGLYKDNSIVLIDEPTTNLDECSAKVVMKDIFNMAENKMIILVCHEWKKIIKKVNGIISIKNKNIDVNILCKGREVKSDKNNFSLSYKYLKKEWCYYMKSNIKMFICFLFLGLFIFLIIAMKNIFLKSMNTDIENSLDYNKFYLSKCETNSDKGISIKNCRNLNEKELNDLKEKGIYYEFNYDYLLNAFYNRNDLAVINNKNARLESGRYPRGYYEVIASNEYNVGDKIELKSNLMVSDKYVDVHKTTLMVEVVGIYKELKFLSEKNIYFDYKYSKDYFENEILINNGYSVYEYFNKLPIDSYKYLCFSNKKPENVDAVNNKYEFYSTLKELYIGIERVFWYIELMLILLCLYFVSKFNKSILIDKQKTNAFLIANSLSVNKSVFSSVVINITLLFLATLFLIILSEMLGFHLYMGLFVCLICTLFITLQTSFYYRKKNVSNLIRW